MLVGSGPAFEVEDLVGVEWENANVFDRQGLAGFAVRCWFGAVEEPDAVAAHYFGRSVGGRASLSARVRRAMKWSILLRGVK